MSNEEQAWKTYPKIFFEPLGGRTVFKSRIEMDSFRGLHKIKSSFWRAVLTKWLSHSYHEVVVLKRSDPINNNNCVKYRGETLFLQSAINKSCITISDLMVGNRLMNLNEYRTKFGLYPRDFLDYNAMFNALKRINLTNIDISSDVLFKQHVLGKLGRKLFYRNVLSPTTPICIQKWERKLGVTINEPHWKLIHDLKETRLRSLCWKIVHDIYPGNYLLYKMRISDTDRCHFCNEVDDTVHFFFQCTQVRPLWIEVAAEIDRFLGISVVLTEAMVILGVNIPHATSTELRKIYHAIAIGKLAVSKFRYGPVRSLLEIYKTDSRMRELWPVLHA